MADNKFYGKYRGIVVQNNDPELRGRVKVWVPHINATMYEEWNQLASDKYLTSIQTATHVFLGQNVLSNLTPILLRLKEKLPWCEIAQPIIGSGSSGFFQASRVIKSPVDADQAILSQPLDGGIAKISFGAEELTGIHALCQTTDAIQGQLKNNLKKSRAQVKNADDAKGSKYVTIGGGTKDLSSMTAPTITNEEIKPLKHPDSGQTVIPLGPTGDQLDTDACGSSPQHAFHKAPIRDDFNQQGTEQANNNRANPYTHLYRPPNHENKARGCFSIPDVGAIVWCFFENGDPQYPIVDGISYGGEDYRGVWEANKNETSSPPEAEKVFQGYGYEIAQGMSPDYPSSFQNRDPIDKERKDDVEDNLYRSKFAMIERGGSFEIVSTYERELVRLSHFSGSFIEFNKLCTSRLATDNDQLLVLKDQFSNIHGNKTIHVNKDYDLIAYGDYYRKIGDIRRWKPYSDNIKELMRPIHDMKRLFEVKRAVQTPIDTAPDQSQIGTLVECPVCAQGKEFYQINTVSPSRLTPTDMLMCGFGNLWGREGQIVEGGSFQFTLQGEPGVVKNMYKEPCWCCGGTGKSPSTQDGDWQAEPLKQQITKKLISITEDLTEQEKQLGRAEHREGGNLIDIIAKNKHQVIGLSFNDFESYRKDIDGKLVPYGMKIEEGGVYPEYIKSPLIEAVHVDDLAGGDYDLTVCSKFNVRVGGGGIRFQTIGNLTFGGQIVTIAGEQLILSARSGIVFDAGSRFDVEADVITLRPRIVERNGKKTQQVAIMGSLNVAQNAIIRGGAHVEGEFTTQHITAPREWHLTEVEPIITKASIKGGFLIGVCACGPVTSVCAPDAVEVNPHVHLKADPAWTLVERYQDVRITAARLNEVGVVMPHPVIDGERYLEEVYPKEVMGRFVEGTHFKPEEAPNGDDAAMEPDPDLVGEGDGTESSNTQASKTHDETGDEAAQDGLSAAKQFKSANVPGEFVRDYYDASLVKGI